MLSASFIGIIVVSLLSLLLGIVTLSANSKAYANRAFAALSGLSGIYVAVNYLADHDQVRGLFWVRGTFFLASFMILFLTLFLNRFPHRKLKSRWDVILSLAATLMAAITVIPQFVPGVVPTPGRTNVLHGPLY